MSSLVDAAHILFIYAAPTPQSQCVYIPPNYPFTSLLTTNPEKSAHSRFASEGEVAEEQTQASLVDDVGVRQDVRRLAQLDASLVDGHHPLMGLNLKIARTDEARCCTGSRKAGCSRS